MQPSPFVKNEPKTNHTIYHTSSSIEQLQQQQSVVNDRQQQVIVNDRQQPYNSGQHFIVCKMTPPVVHRSSMTNDGKLFTTGSAGSLKNSLSPQSPIITTINSNTNTVANELSFRFAAVDSDNAIVLDADDLMQQLLQQQQQQLTANIFISKQKS